jgi:opacity protein-like surface antigen
MAGNGTAFRRGAARMAACLIVLLAAVASAKAADWNDDFLRGSFQPKTAAPAYASWSGTYFGGQLGWSSATVDYSNSVSDLTGFILRDSVLQDQVSGLTAMGNEARTHSSFGGFVGYNYQLSDGIVIGGELNYSSINLDSNKSDTITRIINNDGTAPTGHHYYYTTTVTGQSSLHLKDFATFRARAGYEVGQFLPYAFGGIAVGRADYSRSSTVSYTTEDKPDTGLTADPPPNFGPVSNTDSGSNSIAYGGAVGLGVDISVLPNVFVRAEWEYVHFVAIHNIQLDVNTGRVGIGVKF